MHNTGRATGAALITVLALVVLTGCRSDTDGGAPAGRPSTPHSAETSSSAAPTASSTAPQATKVVHFRAYTGAGAPLTASRSAGKGQCFSTSITVPIAHAYRCFGGKEILDPCFAAPTRQRPSSVLCYLDPWSAARRLTLTRPLPKGTPLRSPRPWAIELANGARCLSITGTVQTDRGVPLTYSCPGGRGAGLVAGSGTPMSAQYGRPPHGALQRVAVTTVWTG